MARCCERASTRSARAASFPTARRTSPGGVDSAGGNRWGRSPGAPTRTSAPCCRQMPNTPFRHATGGAGGGWSVAAPVPPGRSWGRRGSRARITPPRCGRTIAGCCWSTTRSWGQVRRCGCSTCRACRCSGCRSRAGASTSASTAGRCPGCGAMSAPAGSGPRTGGRSSPTMRAGGCSSPAASSRSAPVGRWASPTTAARCSRPAVARQRAPE